MRASASDVQDDLATASAQRSQAWDRHCGSRLERGREAAGLSRAEVARAIGVSAESVRRWERGGSRPSEETLDAYLVAIGLSTLPRGGDSADERDPLSRELLPLLVKSRRAQLGLTQAAAAALLGVAQATFAGWEIGRALPGRDLAGRIAHFLERSEPEVASMLTVPLALEMQAWCTFGRIVGERRVALGLDRRGLASRLAVSPRTIAAWELGEKRPRVRQVHRLAGVLDVEPAVLLAALPEDLPTTELGKLMRSRQRALGLSREELAVRVGVDTATVSRWVWGHNVPTGERVTALARGLQVDAAIVRACTGAISGIDVGRPPTGCRT